MMVVSDILRKAGDAIGADLPQGAEFAAAAQGDSPRSISQVLSPVLISLPKIRRILDARRSARLSHAETRAGCAVIFRPPPHCVGPADRGAQD
jgi:hypothetical protein